MAFDDNYSLKLLYALADNKPYDPKQSWVCANTFIESYPSVKKEFKLDGQFKQIKWSGRRDSNSSILVWKTNV